MSSTIRNGFPLAPDGARVDSSGGKPRETVERHCINQLDGVGLKPLPVNCVNRNMQAWSSRTWHPIHNSTVFHVSVELSRWKNQPPRQRGIAFDRTQRGTYLSSVGIQRRYVRGNLPTVPTCNSIAFGYDLVLCNTLGRRAGDCNSQAISWDSLSGFRGLHRSATAGRF